MKKLIAFVCLCVSLYSCKKSDTEYCYACHDVNNQPLSTYCGTSEDDAFEKAKQANGPASPFADRAYFKQQCPKQ